MFFQNKCQHVQDLEVEARPRKSVRLEAFPRGQGAQGALASREVLGSTEVQGGLRAAASREAPEGTRPSPQGAAGG